MRTHLDATVWIEHELFEAKLERPIGDAANPGYVVLSNEHGSFLTMYVYSKSAAAKLAQAFLLLATTEPPAIPVPPTTRTDPDDEVPF